MQIKESVAGTFSWLLFCPTNCLDDKGTKSFVPYWANVMKGRIQRMRGREDKRWWRVFTIEDKEPNNKTQEPKNIQKEKIKNLLLRRRNAL